MKKNISYDIFPSDYNNYFQDFISRNHRMKKEQNRTALYLVILIICLLGAGLLETFYLRLGL